MCASILTSASSWRSCRNDIPMHLSLEIGKREEGRCISVWRVHERGRSGVKGWTATCGVWPPRRRTNNAYERIIREQNAHTRTCDTSASAGSVETAADGYWTRPRTRLATLVPPTRRVTLSVYALGEKPGIRRSRGHRECNRRTALALLASLQRYSARSGETRRRAFSNGSDRVRSPPPPPATVTRTIRCYVCVSAAYLLCYAPHVVSTLVSFALHPPLTTLTIGGIQGL